MARPARMSLGACAVVLALALSGCGLGAGPGTSNVTLTITRGFGSRQIGSATESRVPGGETVMRMLERKFPNVGLRYGGGFVESIDGQAGGSSRLDWFYYVNGVQAPKGAAQTALHQGDRVWWDLHDWTATDSIPAVVGSFPEPFQRGIAGQRLPTTLECGAGMTKACNIVETALDRAGVPVASQYIGTGSGSNTLGVVVGTWAELRAEVAAGLVDHGPSASGVYARFGQGGRTLLLLNAQGHVALTLGAGAGLVAATADTQSAPTWLITGTNAAGVATAARAVNARSLHDHFALAVQGGEQLPLPLEGIPR